MSEKVKRYTMSAPEYGLVEANCQCEDTCDCWKIKPKEIEWVTYLDYHQLEKQLEEIRELLKKADQQEGTHNDFDGSVCLSWDEWNEILKAAGGEDD